MMGGIPAILAAFQPDVRISTDFRQGVEAGRSGPLPNPSSARFLGQALAEIRQRFASPGVPAFWDRARYIDAEQYTNVISIAYWTDVAAFDAWYAAEGTAWTDPERAADGAGTGMSGMIEEHAYWGSMRDRLPLSQIDPLYPSGAPTMVEDGPVRTVVLHENACLIRSGQDLTDTGDRERTAYLSDVEPSLREGMDFLRDEGNGIGCYDNRYMVVLDDDDQPTERTFGMSWWRDMAALEDWAASHPTHVQILGVAMRHLSSFGPDAAAALPRGHRACRHRAALRVPRLSRPDRLVESIVVVRVRVFGKRGRWS
jgi:aldoxime dehydratase